MHGEFTGELITRLVLTDDKRAAETVAPFGYITSYRMYIDVPIGTQTDLATLPGIARIFFTKLDRTSWGSVIHDRLISARTVSRREADFIFWEALRTSGVGRVKSWTYWASVRFWGILKGD
jgi:hypothetical protein